MADEAAAAPATRVLLRREDRVYVIVGLIIVAGIAVVTTAALMAPGRQGDIWLEIAKSTMYLVALAVAGGVVTTVVRDRDAAREERLRWREHRLAFLDRLDDSYTQIKAARRLLRTLGFVAASSQPLDGEQVHGFRTQMATLNEAQLTFEMAARQVRPASFGLRSGEIEHELADIGHYLRRVLRDWEADPVAIATGGDSSALGRWPHLMAFTAYDEESAQTFTEGVADRMGRIELLIHSADEP